MRQYLTFPPLYPHLRMRMNANSVVKNRYQNFIITPEANNKTYRTAMPYVFKAGGSITGYDTNLVSQ